MEFNTDRKYWGWGAESNALPEPMLQRARAYLAARFGGAAPESRPVPVLDALRMPQPALANSPASSPTHDTTAPARSRWTCAGCVPWRNRKLTRAAS